MKPVESFLCDNVVFSLVKTTESCSLLDCTPFVQLLRGLDKTDGWENSLANALTRIRDLPVL